MKYIHAVEYDRLSDGSYQKQRILGEKYEDEFNGEEKTVNAINEKVENGQRTILICYIDGSDEEVFNIFNIYRRAK